MKLLIDQRRPKYSKGDLVMSVHASSAIFVSLGHQTGAKCPRPSLLSGNTRLPIIPSYVSVMIIRCWGES